MSDEVQTSGLGDVNGDGVVDTVDASLILKEYANISSGGEPTLDPAVADVNKDGAVDSVDHSYVMDYYMKKSSGVLGDISFDEFMRRKTFALGDVDGDGKVTYADADLIEQQLSSSQLLFDPSVGDVDKDGKITENDALLVRRYADYVTRLENAGTAEEGILSFEEWLSPTNRLGDMDSNGIIDVRDSDIILGRYADLSQAGDKEYRDILGDVNDDGVLDASDSSMLLSYIEYCERGGKLSLIEYVNEKLNKT